MSGTTPTHDRLRIVLPVLILGIGVAGFLILALHRPAPPSRAPLDVGLPEVEVVSAVRHQGGLNLDADGVVVPYREIVLAAEVAGRVVRKAPSCRAGHFVAAGTVLLEIDPRDYDLEVRRLKMELQQADVTLQELDVEVANTQALAELAQQELELQQNELRRQLELVAKNFSSQSALDQAKRSELTARNALTALHNQLSLLRTRRSRLESSRQYMELKLEQAELNLARTQVTAPVDGVIVRDFVEQDTYVAPGTQLVAMEDTSQVEVRCSLRMDQLYWLWQQYPAGSGAAAGGSAPWQSYQVPRTPVTVVYSLGGRRFAWNGVLARYDGIGLDETTRTVPCRVTIDEPRSVREIGAPAEGALAGPPALVRGMFVRVRVHSKPQVSLVEVPDEALRPGGRVWRVRDQRLHVVQVEVVSVTNGTAVVHAPGETLAAGDRVVVSPLAGVYDGMKVAIREAAAQEDGGAAQQVAAQGEEHRNR